MNKITEEKIKLKTNGVISFLQVKKSQKLTKEERSALLSKRKVPITRLGNRLDSHTRRNLNTIYINYKIFHLLRDPFIY